MKRTFLAAIAALATLFAVPALAQQASVFGDVRLGAGAGSAFSGSETGSSSHTETWGNGEAQHSSFTGATNTARVGVGFHDGANFEGRVETFTSGETFSQSEGSQAGGAFAGGSGFGNQNGSAFGQTGVFGASGFARIGGGFGFGQPSR